MNSAVKQDMTKVLVTIADDNYFLYAIFCFDSLRYLDEAYRRVIIYVTEDSNSSKHQMLIDRIAGLEVITVSPKVNLLTNQEGSYITGATFMKLWLTDFVSTKSDLIIYFDPDVLFLRNLRKAFERISQPENFGAVSIPKSQGSHLSKIIGRYFNAGFLVINGQNFNFDLAKTYLAKHPEAKELKYLEQDVLNLCYQGVFQELPKTLNFFPYRELNAKRVFFPHIIHFVGANKPWKSSYTTIYHVLWIQKFNSFCRRIHLNEESIDLKHADFRHALISVLVRFQLFRSGLRLLKRNNV
jgi:lipopolysaccharide biosynthesis glycosyltransferase